MGKVTEALKGAIDKHVPKIKTRTLPHPQIDRETKELMEESQKIKTLLAMNIDFPENRRKLTKETSRVDQRKMAEGKC